MHSETFFDEVVEIAQSIDAAGAFYTIDRLREQVKKLSGGTSQIGPVLVEDVRRFLGQAPQNDDMCLVCFGRE